MISIVIPAYNEENAITETVRKCREVLSALVGDAGEVVVVDDCSSDRTADLAEKAGAIVVRHPANAGYGRSLKDGIRAAKNDTIVITDADGTYPLESIPAIYTEYKKGFDMVVGARQGTNYDESFKKKILRIILKRLVEYTSGRRIDDINSGLRIFSKNTISQYFDTLCDTFSFTTSATLAYMMTNRFVAYIPIRYHKRVGKTKVRLFRDTLRTLQYIVEAILFYNPLKIFLLLCWMILLFGAVNVVLAFVFHLTSAFILSVASVILAMMFFGMGLVAVLMKQILMRLRFGEKFN
jgi:glycosyltransferase involved in cell wall biosynthesis